MNGGTQGAHLLNSIEQLNNGILFLGASHCGVTWRKLALPFREEPAGHSDTHTQPGRARHNPANVIKEVSNRESD